MILTGKEEKEEVKGEEACKERDKGEEGKTFAEGKGKTRKR